MERTRHERASLLGCVGEPLKRNVRRLFLADDMAKKPIVISLALIALVLAGVLFLYLSAEAAPVSLNLSSPANVYRVELNEHTDTFEHWAPIRLRLGDPRKFDEIRFSTFKGDRALAKDELLWDDTSGNSRFFELYRYRWLTDSVLQFGWDEALPKSKLDEVTVFNDTNQPVDELRIRSGELFLILDLQPKAATTFSTHPQSWLSWIACEGNLGPGKPISYGGVNFFIRDNDDTHVPQHYCVVIRDNGVVIQSREMDGYRDENGGKISVSKGNECAANKRRP